MDDLVRKRYECNRQIIQQLACIVEKHPELRFSQILLCANVVLMDSDEKSWVDDFYLESSELLRRMRTVK